VNLLLNRASAWLDVGSYLPYEGKVIFKNKTARKAYVRVPAWVDKQAVKCRVNQRDFPRHWLNNYLIVEELTPQGVVTVEFPVVDSSEKQIEPSYGQEYPCRFKGNTLIDISPRAERLALTYDVSDDGSRFPVNKGYPLYQADFYKQLKARMKKVTRCISPVII